MSKARKYIEKLNREYINNHIVEQERDMLIAENEVEQKDVKGYHGREILELLQNADDAYQKAVVNGCKPDKKLEVFIKFDGDSLEIANTGTYFDEAGIKAIVQGNNSPKNKGKYIGNKGTGFRSVLNWADEIRIYSGEYSLLFSKEIAHKKFLEIKEYPQIQKQIKNRKKIYIPILAIPENIEKVDSDYDTVIKIKINKNKNNDKFGVEKQIENIDLRFLLFLPNIERIIINIFGKSIIYERKVKIDCFKEISLSKYIDDEMQISESYYVFDKTIKDEIVEDDESKDILLSIAVPKDFSNFESTNLYSFFPLHETISPFNCILHASYELGSNRNTITKSNVNEKIIRHQLEFLHNVSAKFAKKGFENTAASLLTPIGIDEYNWRFTKPFENFSLEDFYLKLVSDAKVFQTVNEDYIAISDKPKVLNCALPSPFTGTKFTNLLKSFAEVERERNISILAKKIAVAIDIEIKYYELDLLEVINSISDEWTIYQQVETFIWWNKYYYKSLPNLLKTQDGEWLRYKQDCFFLVGDVNNNIPIWVNVPSLHCEYQEELFAQSLKEEQIIAIKNLDRETHISRLISQNNIFKTLNFAYRDRSNIVTTVNSSVDSYDKSLEFVIWLWNNYGQDYDWTPPNSKDRPVRYKFPNKSNSKFMDSRKLFFGHNFGNELAIKLFDLTYGEISSFTEFLEKGVNKEMFKNFLKKFKVKEFPPILCQQVFPLSEYSKIYESKILALPELNNCTMLRVSYELPFISNLEHILQTLTTSDIIRWINDDYNLKSFLRKTHVYEEVSIGYRANRQVTNREYRGEIINYLLFFFNNYKWVDINEKKYAPSEILSAVNSKANLEFKDLVPILSDDYIYELSEKTNLKCNQVEEIIRLFSFCEKPTDLNSNDFYGMLLKLPTYDFIKSEKLSKTIYRILEQHTSLKTFRDSDNKRKFFNEGKVLTSYKGKLQYVDANKSFLPSTKIIIKKNIPIIEKRQRTSNANFKNVLGCKEYEQEYKIITNTIRISTLNSFFQEYYADFIPFASAYAERNNNISANINKLKISITSSIEIQENDTIRLIDGEFITLRESINQWYIVTKSQELDIDVLSSEIENIFSNIANTPGFDEGKLGELFRTTELKRREFLILKDFGTLDVIGSINSNNNLKFSFIETIKSFNLDIDVLDYNIDFDNFNDLTNIKKVVQLLKDINCDIDDFDKAGFAYPLDLIPFFKSELQNFKSAERKNYINYIFNVALTDLNARSDFIRKKHEFINFEINNYCNSIKYNIKKDIEANFGMWTSSYENDAEETYAKNYAELNPQNLYSDDIIGSQKVQTMIYFNEVHNFNDWMEECRKKQDIEQTKQNIDVYIDYRNIIPKEENVTFSNGKKKRNKKPKKSGSYNEKESEKKQRAKKVLGNKGELLIYNLLCDKFGRNNVTPFSEAFVDLGILKPGQGVSGVYDITYKDEKNKEFFVEVKTGSEKSFFITPNELDFAKRNPDYFELYLVYDVDKDEPKFRKIPPKFWKHKEFRLTEVIEKIEVEF